MSLLSWNDLPMGYTGPPARSTTKAPRHRFQANLTDFSASEALVPVRGRPEKRRPKTLTAGSRR
jgi:hypothetical protein